MKKIHLKLAIIFALTYLPLVSYAASIEQSDFTLEEASYRLFHHYDDEHQVAVWERIAFPSASVRDGFWGRNTGLVSFVFFAPFMEEGKHKYFLLTKAVPVGEPFNCHACLPLLGAVIFVKKDKRWMIESKNLFLMYEGEYAASPTVKWVDLPQDKHGLMLAFAHYGDDAQKVKNVLVYATGSKIHYRIINAAATLRSSEASAL